MTDTRRLRHSPHRASLLETPLARRHGADTAARAEPSPAPARSRPDETAAGLVASIVGWDPPVAFACWDGSRVGPAEPPATVVLRSPDVLRRLVAAPNDLGLGRAWVAGDIDVEGDLYAALALRRTVRVLRLSPGQVRTALRLLGPAGLRPLPPPEEEARLRGRLHGRRRDAAAISHHYDVSNAFYRIVLGPSLTYSCAVWETAGSTLEQAQTAKHELISRKLDLRPGARLLDVGCGWASMLLHAAEHHGVRAVGVTVSARQAELAQQRVAAAGLGERIDVLLQDYRDVADGPYDAVSSIGMFEHVGLAQLRRYFIGMNELVRPGGFLLNQGISRPPRRSARRSRRSFIDAYVFPDGELHEVGSVVTTMQQAGFEVLGVESLREHYASTLRAWVANLEANWDAAVDEVGERRARIWRLYMAACALAFEDGDIQVHQVLAASARRRMRSLPRRRYDATPLETWA